MFGKKKAEKKSEKKIESKTFVDGKQQVDVPEKIPELEIPIPPPEQKAKQPISAQEVYDEGRSVGFQEGMIHAMKLLEDHLHQHQARLQAELEQKKEVNNDYDD